MSTAAVAPFTGRRLLARLAAAQAGGRLPSVVAGVLRDGELAWSGAYGDEAVPGHDPLDVQYRIGSITKTMTAVLVLQLVRDGRLGLDEPAATWLGDVAYADRTIRSLLAHNSGMRSEPIGSWWECVRARILEPLGMSRTSYLPDGAAAPGRSVHPYAGTLVDEPATDTGAMAPAGQVWATLADLATYNAFLLAGHPDVLGLDELLVASHPQSGDRDDALGYAHGLGFQLQAGGSGMLVGHTGSMPGFLAGCFVDRPRRTGAVVLTNATTGLVPADLVVCLLEELERSEPTIPAPWRPTAAVPAELADALGVWHWGNTPFVFAMDGDRLVASRAGVEKYAFAVVDGRVIGTSGYHAGEELQVVRRPDGSVSHLDVATFIYTRTPYDPEAPIPGGHPA